MKNWTFITKDFDLIRNLVKANKVDSIGIDWVYSIFTWSWVYYYKYSVK